MFQPVWRGTRLLGVGLLVLIATAAGAADAGRIINASNCDEARDLLPPPVFDWVKAGDWTLPLSEMETDVNWEPAFQAASAANAGRFGVDQEGGMIEPQTGKRPPHVYGFPFPDIDLDDSTAGVKAMWNATAASYKFGRLQAPFGLHWVGRHGFERFVGGRVFVIAFDYQPRPVPHSDGTEVRDMFEALRPASVNGIATLTWRFRDNRPDLVWGYLPSVRRVRQITSANRSDPAYGSDLVQDDGMLWAGKNQSFRWKLVEARDVLVSTAATALVPLVPGRFLAGEQEWRSPASFPGARFGHETKGWAGAPWLPTNMVWVKRPVWVVEGYRRDPYYAYGRQLFYVDRVTFKIYYKVIYAPSGEYWKTVFNDLGLAVAGDGRRYPVVAAAIAVDDRANHATYTRGNAPDYIVEYNSAQAQPELLTVSGLLGRGK